MYGEGDEFVAEIQPSIEYLELYAVTAAVFFEGFQNFWEVISASYYW